MRRLISRGFVAGLVALALLVAGATTGQAQTQWTTAGPQGGDVRALLVKGPGDIVAATYGAGLYQTSSGAATWATSFGFCNYDTSALAYSTPAGPLFVGYYGGVCRQGQGRVGTLPASSVNAVAASGNYLFAGTSSGLYSIHWFSANSSTPWTTEINSYVHALLSDEPRSRVYIGASAGLYEAEFSGQQWQYQAVGAPSTPAYALTSDGTYVYAVQGCTIRRKLLSGGEWTTYGPSICADQLLAPDTSTLYAATSSGVFKSIDGGAFTRPRISVFADDAAF
jgi:ligand-binding sensor domain-containing protein